MAEPRQPDTDRGSPPRMPRWVKLSVIILASLVVLAVAIVVFSGGQHGPGRHVGAGDPNPAPVTTVQGGPVQVALSGPGEDTPSNAGH